MTEAETPSNVTGMATKLGTTLIAALPAQFLMLCLINVVFLYFVMSFLGQQMEARTGMANKLLDACIAETRQDHPKPP
jgi:hypothetical protein